MTQPSSNKQGIHLWQLQQELGIALWQNSLSIPNPEFTYLSSHLHLQQELNFVFVQEGPTEESRFLVFISEQTQFSHLCQFLPFLFEHYQFYLCEDHLIKERLSFIDHREAFSADNKATKQLNTIIASAVSKNASDIHIESHPYNKLVRIRVHGQLEKLKLDEEIEDALFSKIKLISKMDISRTRVPQDGHFSYTSESGKQYDMRTSTVTSVFGEKIVIRLLPSTTVKFSMSELGFPKNHIPIIKKHIQKKSGMILFTGPTGSGKTTSLYAILNELNAEMLNIITIEDPVEYRLEKVTQVEVNDKAGLSFSKGLRAFLRQDPDVILVGEIRDHETAQIAARAAQTGHLVLSTLHSNDVFETIRRLKNLGVESEDIASSLKLIISQRLVQKHCVCQGDTECPKCLGTGVSGRIPLMEVLEISTELKKLIFRGSHLSELQDHARKTGFLSLNEVGQKLVRSKVISISELDALGS